MTRLPNMLSIAARLLVLPVAGLAPAAEPEIDPSELSRPRPLAPAAAQAAFQIKPGFRIELAAAEPQIVDPVAMAFDEHGALYVVEMRDYSERRAEVLSRVKRLTDTDGDGVYETATVFLEGLAWATGVVCADGGVYVAASPDLLFAKDTDGDGVADERRVVFTGFGAGRKLNVQALVNSLTYGPDNRLWGATAGNGGVVGPLTLTGHDFSFAPGGTDLRAETGTAQFGLTFDTLGRRYVCSNSAHIQWVAYERPYGAGALRPPSPRLIDIPADGAAAEVFRLSPEEGWRVVRTRWRASGVVAGIVEGGGRSSGYFTSASGLGAYIGDLFPPEFADNIFVGDVGSNLLHRKVLRETPDGPVAERPADERGREFLATPDNWFRPVAVANGPDGALYVVDFYREIIEHPDSLPPNLKSQLDLNSGNDRGRLWRIVPEDATPRRRVTLAALADVDLARLTHHANGWHRTTARRLLLERRATAAAPALRETITADSLAALDGLGELTRDDVKAALAAPDLSAVVWALRWLETSPADAAALADDLAALLRHPSPAVRWQFALSLAAFDVPPRAAWRAALWQESENSPRQREALLAGFRDAKDVWALWTALPYPDDALAELLARAKDDTIIKQAVAWLATRPEEEQTHVFQLAARLDAELARAEWRAPARRALHDHAAPLDRRLAAARLLATDADPAAVKALGETALHAAAPEALRLAALPALRAAEAPRVFAAWRSFSTPLRDALLARAVARADWQPALLEALERKHVAAGEITAAQAAQLRALPDAAWRARALAVLGEPPPDRQAVVAERLAALKLDGDAAKGETTFRLRCLTCHRHGDEGAEVGPDRVTFRNQGPATLLLHLIDPNREVAPRYFSVQATTTDGETYLGLPLRDDAGGLTLRLPGGGEVTLDRARIATLERQTRSLMPEGLEAGLSDQDLADLMAFLVK